MWKEVENIYSWCGRGLIICYRSTGRRGCHQCCLVQCVHVGGPKPRPPHVQDPAVHLVWPVADLCTHDTRLASHAYIQSMCDCLVYMPYFSATSQADFLAAAACILMAQGWLLPHSYCSDLSPFLRNAEKSVHLASPLLPRHS